MDQKPPRTGKDSHDGSTPSASLATQRAEFGAELKALRESSGLTLANLSQATRISVAFLTALETGDLDKLPGAVFGRGFLQSIAKTINIAPDALLERYADLWPKTGPASSVLKVEIKNKPVVGRSEAVREGVVEITGMIAQRHGVAIGKWTASVVVVALVALAGVKFGPDLLKTVIERGKAMRLDASSGAASVVGTVRPGDGVTSGAASVAKSGAQVAVVAPAAPTSDAPATEAAETPPDDPATMNAIATSGGDVPSDTAAEATKNAVTPPADVVTQSGSESPDEEPSADAPKSAPMPESAPPPPTMTAPQGASAPAAQPATETTASAPSPSTETSAVDAAKPASEAAKPGAKQQMLELTVTEPVTVRLVLDQGQTVAKELAPNTYKFAFADHAELLINDASALKVSFNGRSLGALGNKGRVRRLSFQAAAPKPAPDQNL